ncbi:NAD(P)/FAD-dependent oxidoreductase [Ottowia testudinis]|uniref:FAD-dependent oxidoreductase n=1 Tax=Ottowia testudinis TaxID=2816950 RepID=A0A975H6V8_9BURK|nr:FAD-dependent oxidoreductase [Ottowia testudinis]QTD46397.1 FAD-dependent oxidoreductase [Ottowia testudinis]
MTFDRRRFIAASAAAASVPLLSACANPGTSSAAAPYPAFIGRPAQKLLPSRKAPRIVICGGGWGGLTTAANLRQLAPQAEVVLLDRNPVFFSSPLSNMWLVNMLDGELLTHDYLRVAHKLGYLFFQAEVQQIDRDQRTVTTSVGTLDYDWLVIAPGIRYNYESWFGNDRAAANAARQRFPSAYASNAEFLTIKRALHHFKGGELVMTLPPPPQRCPPSPYERACLIAWHFKTHGIKGHITILDHKPAIAPIGLGYKRAFEELYKDFITYVPNAHVQEVDPFNQRIRTAAGDHSFDHAILMAPHQAGDLAWLAGAVTPASNGWADMDVRTMQLQGDERSFVIGDAIGAVSTLDFRYYPKAAHVANRLGRIVAYQISERIAGRTPETRLPDNLCYMVVNGTPGQALNVQFDYSFDDQGRIKQVQRDYNERTPALFKDDFRWADFMFEEMFGGLAPPVLPYPAYRA